MFRQFVTLWENYTEVSGLYPYISIPLLYLHLIQPQLWLVYIWHHLPALFASVCSISLQVLTSGPWADTAAASRKRFSPSSDSWRGKSLIEQEYKSGPKIDPCGTPPPPQFTCCSADHKPPACGYTVTWALLSICRNSGKGPEPSDHSHRGLWSDLFLLIVTIVSSYWDIRWIKPGSHCGQCAFVVFPEGGWSLLDQSIYRGQYTAHQQFHFRKLERL